MAEENKIPAIRFKGFSGEWNTLTLGELGAVATNKRIFMHQTSSTGDVPFYKIGTFGREPKLFISQGLFEIYKKRFPYPLKGDLLFSVIGSIGRVVEHRDENEYFQDSNIVWLQHNGAIVNTFLKQFYSFVKWSGLEGSTIKHLYNRNILETQIDLPCQKEQTKIGSYFQQLDTLITQHQRKHDKLLNVKKAMLEKMFPKKSAEVPEIRFKGFSEKWEERKLGGICNFLRGKTLSWNDIEINGKYECVLYGHLYTEYGMVIKKVNYLTNNNSNELVRSCFGDVLIPASDTTPTGLARATSIEKSGIILGGDINIIRPKDFLSGSFLSYNINCNRQKLIKLIKGTSVKHLVNSDLENVEIFIAKDINEQKRISVMFQYFDTLLSLHQTELEKLKNIKKACLEKMFV